MFLGALRLVRRPPPWPCQNRRATDDSWSHTTRGPGSVVPKAMNRRVPMQQQLSPLMAPNTAGEALGIISEHQKPMSPATRSALPIRAANHIIPHQNDCTLKPARYSMPENDSRPTFPCSDKETLPYHSKLCNAPAGWAGICRYAIADHKVCFPLGRSVGATVEAYGICSDIEGKPCPILLLCLVGLCSSIATSTSNEGSLASRLSAVGLPVLQRLDRAARQHHHQQRQRTTRLESGARDCDGGPAARHGQSGRLTAATWPRTRSAASDRLRAVQS